MMGWIHAPGGASDMQAFEFQTSHIGGHHIYRFHKTPMPQTSIKSKLHKYRFIPNANPFTSSANTASPCPNQIQKPPSENRIHDIAPNTSPSPKDRRVPQFLPKFLPHLLTLPRLPPRLSRHIPIPIHNPLLLGPSLRNRHWHIPTIRLLLLLSF